MSNLAKEVSKMKKGFSTFLFSFVALILGVVGGFYGLTYLTLPKTESVNVTEDVYYSNNQNQTQVADFSQFDSEISIHFLELGNKYTGDCTYIKAGDTDILIDCGSKSNSVSVVAEYLNKYVTDGKLEYVIVTHAHQDHYAGFATPENINSIFDLFKVETIIDFAQTNQKSTSNLYKNYLRERQAAIDKGAKHYTALDCVNGTNGASQTFDLAQDTTLKILNSHYYTNVATTENDYSVCCLISQRSKNFLFTGDLEKGGEEYLVSMNDLPQVDLYKAGHHGSKTSSSETLMAKVKPKTVCVCCCAGSSEYTKTVENQFPTQIFINNVAPYTSEVYVTTMCLDYKNNQFCSFNGNIVYASNKSAYQVFCSNNTTLLKDSDWFKQNRTCPEAWK